MKGKILLYSFLFVLLAKAAQTEYLSRLDFCQSPDAAGGHWANVTGDSFSYIGAMENLVSKGSYYFINEKGQEVKAGRPPHYAAPYFIFRQFLSPTVALDLFVLLQLMAEAAAILCMALLAMEITRRKWAFYTSLILGVISLYITVWSYNTYTDALSSSLMMIASYFYFKYLQQGSRKNLIWFSILFALITCYRPYMVLVYPFLAIVELVRNRKTIQPILQKALILALPLAILLAPWMIRNYLVMDRIFIFQQDMYAGYGFTEEELAVRKALGVIGEDGGAWWDRKSAASYFNHRSLSGSVYKYPDYIKKDSILLAKLETLRMCNLAPQRDASKIIRAARNLESFYQSEYAFRYYVMNHISHAARFLFHNGSYHLPVNKSSVCYQPVQWILKLGQSLLYYLALVFGGIGLIMMARRNRHYWVFLFPSLYLLFLFPIFFGLTEWRYFLPFYYFHLLGLVYFLHYFIENRRAARHLT